MPWIVVLLTLPVPTAYPDAVHSQKPPLSSTGVYVMLPVWALGSM
jgi:hypothetical protein